MRCRSASERAVLSHHAGARPISIGVVNREHNSWGHHRGERAVKWRVVELATGGQVEVVPHVLRDPLTRRILHWQFVYQIIDPPHVERYAFAEVAKHHL